MLTFKFVVLFLVYVLSDIVICGLISHSSESSENGNIQYQQALSGENHNNVPSILTHRLNQIHNARRRSVLLAPLRHVIGHIAGHLGFHRAHTDFHERHFHPHHDFSFHHQHNSHLGHNFQNDFPKHHDSPEYYGYRPRFPGMDYVPDRDEHGFDFPPAYPETNFHHHQIPNDENNYDHKSHDEKTHQPHGIPEEVHKHHQIPNDEKNDDHIFHNEKPHQTHGISEKEHHHQIPNDENNNDHRFHDENPHITHEISEEEHIHHQIHKDENNHDHRSHDEKPHQTHGISEKEHNHHRIPNDEKNHDHRSHDEKPHHGISDKKCNHHQISNDENNHDHISHDVKPIQTHEIPEEKHNHTSTELEQTTKPIKPAIYPPFEGNDQSSKSDDDYPVSDFDKNNKDGKPDDKPKVVEGGAKVENDFSGSAGDGKEIGSAYPDLVHPQQDDVENMGSGEIPPFSKIDIRFRKN